MLIKVPTHKVPEKWHKGIRVLLSHISRFIL
nr:MAG TPA: hypothetical protein [Caudoviricetes sp.]